jgi:hypothetical protein
MQANSNHFTRLSLLDIEALQRRGLTNAMIDAAGFCSLSAEDVLEILKFNPNKSAGLGIPFLHPATREIRRIRVRPDIAPITYGKPAKYLSPRGAGNLLYFPPGCLDRLKDPTEPLYLRKENLKPWQPGKPDCSRSEWLVCGGSVARARTATVSRFLILTSSLGKIES